MSRSPRIRGRLVEGIRRRRARGLEKSRVGPSTKLLDILERHRDEIIDRGTDWVISTAVDLQGKRPREETRRLVERVLEVNRAIIHADDRQPLQVFVQYVTKLRASLEFRVSTLLRGWLSFKRGLSDVLTDEPVGARDKLAMLGLVDEIYYEAIFETCDVYGGKLVQAIKARRDEIEVELSHKREELDRATDEVELLRNRLIALSLPILRVWKGVLLVPLIGEITADRAEHARSELLEAVVRHQARSVLIDVTGLSVVDEHSAGVLGSIIRAVGLLGAQTMIVGVRGEVARVLVLMGEVFPGTRTFSTLDEGLRSALRSKER